MSFRSSSSGGGRAPMTLSQVPASPSFRSSAVNAIAVIPLLSNDRNGQDNPNTHSSQSFLDFLGALQRYHDDSNGNGIGSGSDSGSTAPSSSSSSSSSTGSPDNLLLVVPNSSLTRPGDWKYDETPLKNFHWGHGCQRLSFFDGRPYHSRMAHDRLINHDLTRSWIDLCPHRRTAAVIGVLNVRDCPDQLTLQTAQQEWQQWAERYSTPPYEVTAHGRDFERDFVVQRLFVFDSFHDSNTVDVNSLQLQGGNASLVAFPPCDNKQMMDVHMNVVMNDLAVAVFRELEGRIRESDEITKGGSDGQPLSTQAAKSRFFQLAGHSDKDGAASNDAEEAPLGLANLSISNLAAVVSPDSKLAASRDANKKTTKQPSKRASVETKLQNMVVRNTVKGSSTQAQLLTPLDDVWDFAELNPKDAQEMLRREVGRREKFAADLSLMAGSPLDAYERYMKAAELCRVTCPDPLWYSSALEGCAAAHIAMAEAGGFNIDEYLESSFQLPDAIMACAVVPSNEKISSKQTMSRVVTALCEDALSVLSRHPKLACFRSELLLKLSWYTSEVEDTHIRCLWGLGDGCYGGDPTSEKRRWEMASAAQFNFLDLQNKHGEDVIARNTLARAKRFTDYMHQAVAAGALDPVTRADVALRCASMCLKGLRPTSKPNTRERSDVRIQFRRKASFFAIAAVEAMSEVDQDGVEDRLSALWVHAARLLSSKGDESDVGSYGWATLRAVALHGLVMQGVRDTSEDAAVQLLSLMGEIAPPKRLNEPVLFFSKFDDDEADNSGGNLNDSIRSDTADGPSYIGAGESVVSAARTYVRETRAQVAQARAQRSTFLSGVSKDSSLLTVAQSKWVEDDPVPTILLPMADFSEISESILAMRSVWSAIKFESCFTAQKRVVREISDLRRNIPASSFPNHIAESSSSLPIKITSVVVIKSESHSKLERLKLKQKTQDTGGAMATFFNPYGNKKGEEETTIIPEEEERYILVKFANDLSIPVEIPRCQLKFNFSQSDRIKAPAISFVVPGRTKNFAVQFPFILLKGDDLEESDLTGLFDIKGLHLTCLARSFFLPLKGTSETPSEKSTEPKRGNMPDSASLYPRRNYKGKTNEEGEGILSPQLEYVPPQPNLVISFASSQTPINQETVIPAPIADGEVFALPKLFLSNDSGISGLGKLEELKITAVGLPGHPETVLFDLNGSDTKEKKPEKPKEINRVAKKAPEPTPLSLIAKCEGMDRNVLNGGKKAGASSISLELRSTPDMGACIKSCTVKVTLRYRGKAPSSTMEIWRKRELEIRVLRIQGPRVSSITFRPDLSWKSAYSELCHSLALQEKHNRYRSSKIHVEDRLLRAGSADAREFVASRLGNDPGVHVCGDKVVVFASVVNETGAAIILSSPNGSVGGFEGHALDTIKVMPGVSAKIPMILPRIDRGPNVSEKILSMTRLHWTSESTDKTLEDLTETGGTMVPANRRVRTGSLEIPAACLKSIIDETPTFLSRICKPPCMISVAIASGGENKECTDVDLGTPEDTSVEIDLADWIPAKVLRGTNLSVEFCCARKGTPQDSVRRKGDFVWCGQIRKTLDMTDTTTQHKHRARLIFLKEGDYVVSASVSFSRNDIEDDVKEVWWAEEAQQVRVVKSKVKQ